MRYLHSGFPCTGSFWFWYGKTRQTCIFAGLFCHFRFILPPRTGAPPHVTPRASPSGSSRRRSFSPAPCDMLVTWQNQTPRRRRPRARPAPRRKSRPREPPRAIRQRGRPRRNRPRWALRKRPAAAHRHESAALLLRSELAFLLRANYSCTMTPEKNRACVARFRARRRKQRTGSAEPMPMALKVRHAAKTRWDRVRAARAANQEGRAA